MKYALVSTRILESQHKEPHYAISVNLIRMLSDLGYQSFMIAPAQEHSEVVFGSIKPDLIVLTGGEDIGENRERDQFEYSLLRFSILNNTPVLGICRGMQIMSTYLGGKLVPIKNHVGKNHMIKGTQDSKQFTVNSFHNFAISNLPEKLQVNFCSHDGVIESVKSLDYPWLGIMWHPEREGNEIESYKIIEDFFHIT